MADKTKIGMEFPSYSMAVDKSKIAEFAMAVALKEQKSEINPIYYDEDCAKKAGYQGIPIPPTFLTSFILLTGNGLKEIVDELGVDFNRLLHSEEEYEYYRSIYAGDTINRKTKVVEIYDRGKIGKAGRFVQVIVLETLFINQRGELVAKIRTTAVER